MVQGVKEERKGVHDRDHGRASTVSRRDDEWEQRGEPEKDLSAECAETAEHQEKTSTERRAR